MANRTRCKPKYPGPRFCAAMHEALNNDGESRTGLSTETLYKLNDPRGPQPRIAMVALRRTSRAMPTWLHFCPWCREPLILIKHSTARRPSPGKEGERG